MPKIRVLVVDDAVVMRKLISEVLGRDPHIEVVGNAPNGKLALQKIPQVNPDLITLDVEMPEMDGVTAVREIRKVYPRLPLIIVSTLTARGAETTLEALAAGANDYVTKAANVGGVMEGISRLEKELIPRIKALCPDLISKEPAPTLPPPRPTAAPALPTNHGTSFIHAVPRPSLISSPVSIVCIGVSTGGPNALADFFSRLQVPLPVPMVVVQHMPPVFTKMLAERLAKAARVPCYEAEEGQPIRPGSIYLAPGGKHMEVLRNDSAARVHLHEGPPENSCRPAVDVLFRSVAAAYGPSILSIIMTGMGQDGLRGCQLIREKGGQVIVQDEASSVVWGMPGAVAQAGAADKILPLDQLTAEMVRRVHNRLP
jgi:two-component system chemotaxis response regulator CheB